MISSAERRRSSAWVPPCVIPKRSWPSARDASTWRRAHSVVIRTARSSSGSGASAGEADVEAHRDVRAQPALDLGDALGREARVGPVVDGAERDPVVVERGDGVAQREHLEATRVRQDRATPPREGVEAAELLHEVLPRPEVQVVRVREDDVGAERPHLVRVQGLDGALRADGHERGRADLAVSRRDDARPRGAVRRNDAKAQRLVPSRIATRPRGHPAPPPAMSVSPNLGRMGHASATKQRRIVHGRGANLMSQHQHRVAERVEAVPLRNRLPVELAHDLDPGERHHQREQGRPRQMEVRQ